MRGLRPDEPKILDALDNISWVLDHSRGLREFLAIFFLCPIIAIFFTWLIVSIITADISGEKKNEMLSIIKWHYFT